MQNTVQTETHVIVRWDPALRAECALSYVHDDGEPQLVVTFGPVEPDISNGFHPVIHQMRQSVAPLTEVSS